MELICARKKLVANKTASSKRRSNQVNTRNTLMELRQYSKHLRAQNDVAKTSNFAARRALPSHLNIPALYIPGCNCTRYKHGCASKRFLSFRRNLVRHPAQIFCGRACGCKQGQCHTNQRPPRGCRIAYNALWYIVVSPDCLFISSDSRLTDK